MIRDLSAARLYAILDLGYVKPSALLAAARALLDGGADLLQLRAKGYSEAQIEEFARRVQPLCQAAGIPMILNDYPHLVPRVGAAGVHLGQEDGSLTWAREWVGPEGLVGRSTHTPEQAAAAVEEGFDYLGFGPLFPTPTKQGRPGIGLGEVASVERELGSRVPVFCIGGIRRDNLPQVLAAGARRVVIVSDLLTADSIAQATRTAREQVVQLGGRGEGSGPQAD